MGTRKDAWSCAMRKVQTEDSLSKRRDETLPADKGLVNQLAEMVCSDKTRTG